ncbi:MAG: DUF4239 domain-containing protein [Planctomycetia bacterium]|nr:DUF4239 domain-containing protein [Planctomycetia bacterium]
MEYTGCWNGIVIVGGAIVLSLAILTAVRRLFSAETLREGHDLTGAMLAIVGTLYAVLLGLVVVDAMARFERAMDIVQLESNSLGDVFLLASRLPQPQRERVQNLCRSYAKQVVEVEWPAMERARMSVVARQTALSLAKALDDFEPQTEAHKTVYPAILENVALLWDQRRERAGTALYGIPVVEWVVLGLGAAVLVFFAGLFSVGSPRLQIVVTSLMAVVIGLNLYLVCLFGYPFAGELSVSHRPFDIDIDVFRGVYDDRPAHEGEEHAETTVLPGT